MQYRSAFRVLSALFVASGLAWIPMACSAETSEPTTLGERASVIHVVDGDTVDVQMEAGGNRRVRLLGIDTPEVFDGVECGGRPASAALKRLLPRGTRVMLISDPTQARMDQYERLLRYVTKSSTGVDINRKQVWSGWARVYVYNDHRFSRVSSYQKAQRSADSRDRGIWGSCR